MGCGCKDDKKKIGAAQKPMTTLNDNDFVQAEYVGPAGNRHVVGSFAFNYDPGVPTKKRGGNWHIYYGYISGNRGVKRLVHKEDLRLNPNLWRELPQVAPPPKVHKPQIEPPKPIKPPTILKDVVFELDQLPGVTPAIAKRMKDAGITSKEDIQEAGISGLTKIKGVAENRAKAILRALEKK